MTKLRCLLVGLGVLVLLGTGTAGAQELRAGDEAPAFALEGSDGRTHRLSDYRGQTVILAWFPKAFTSG